MKKKYYKNGDMLLITGVHNIENIVIVLKEFEYSDILRQWQTDTEKGKLTREGFIKYLFDKKFIEKLKIEEFNMEDNF
jgi:hypothetical protein